MKLRRTYYVHGDTGECVEVEFEMPDPGNERLERLLARMCGKALDSKRGKTAVLGGLMTMKIIKKEP